MTGVARRSTWRNPGRRMTHRAISISPFLDVDLFHEKERYQHHIRTPHPIKALCLSHSMSYDDAARSSLIPVSSMAVVPAEVRQFAPRRDRAGPLPDFDIPGFLKRGPKTEEDVLPSARKS
jgi:hypothetical protein